MSDAGVSLLFGDSFIGDDEVASAEGEHLSVVDGVRGGSFGWNGIDLDCASKFDSLVEPRGLIASHELSGANLTLGDSTTFYFMESIFGVF